MITVKSVYDTTYLTAKYLAEELKDDLDAKINIIGMEGLRDEIRAAGFKNANIMRTMLDGEKRYDTCLSEKQFSAYQADPEVKAVVNGFSFKANFRELAIASIYLGREGTKFVTTCDDPTHAVDATTGRLMADTGAFLGSLETLSGRKAHLIGKPNPDAF